MKILAVMMLFGSLLGSAQILPTPASIGIDAEGHGHANEYTVHSFGGVLLAMKSEGKNVPCGSLITDSLCTQTARQLIYSYPEKVQGLFAAMEGTATESGTEAPDDAIVAALQAGETEALPATPLVEVAPPPPPVYHHQHVTRQPVVDDGPAQQSSSPNAGVGVFLGLLICVGGFMLYFLPAWIARKRRHHDWTAIFVVNLFFGWTAIGWFVALVWSCTGNVERRDYIEEFPRRRAAWVEEAPRRSNRMITSGE